MTLAIWSGPAAFAAVKKVPTFTRANFATLVANPNHFKGAHVDIAGEVFSLSPGSMNGTTGVQMWMDPSDYLWNTLVAFRTSQLTPSEGEYLQVVGTAIGTASYENRYGAKVSALVIAATLVTRTDQAAAEVHNSSTGVFLTSCSRDKVLGIAGSIRNPSKLTYNYDIKIGVFSGTTRVGTAVTFQPAVVPGHPQYWVASGHAPKGTGPITCQILTVRRTRR